MWLQEEKNNKDLTCFNCTKKLILQGKLVNYVSVNIPKLSKTPIMIQI